MPSPPSSSPSPSISTADLVRTITERSASLRRSLLWRTLSEVLARTTPIRLVVLGLGSFSGPTRESSLWQYALVEEIRLLLRIPEGEYYLQDPAFTTDDELFFEARGGKAVRVPDAEAMVDAGTCVVAIHLEYTVLEGVLRRWPGVVVCNDLEHFLEMRIGSKEEAEWVRRYVEDTESWGLVGGEALGGGRAFNHSAVYWRKKGGDDVNDVMEKLEDVSIYSLRATSIRRGAGGGGQESGPQITKILPVA